MTDSILTSTKKVLGIVESYEVFDPDIIMHINTVFSTLHQLGLGPSIGFAISDKDATWEDYIVTDLRINSIKTYMALRVRMLFDPPATSYLMNAMQEQIKEFEWRLNVVRENDMYPLLPDDEEIVVIDGGSA